MLSFKRFRSWFDYFDRMLLTKPRLAKPPTLHNTISPHRSRSCPPLTHVVRKYFVALATARPTTAGRDRAASRPPARFASESSRAPTSSSWRVCLRRRPVRIARVAIRIGVGRRRVAGRGRHRVRRDVVEGLLVRLRQVDAGREHVLGRALRPARRRPALPRRVKRGAPVGPTCRRVPCCADCSHRPVFVHRVRATSSRHQAWACSRRHATSCSCAWGTTRRRHQRLVRAYVGRHVLLTG